MTWFDAHFIALIGMFTIHQWDHWASAIKKKYDPIDKLMATFNKVLLNDFKI